MNLSSGVPDSLLFIYHAKKSVHILNYSTRDINSSKNLRHASQLRDLSISRGTFDWGVGGPGTWRLLDRNTSGVTGPPRFPALKSQPMASSMFCLPVFLKQKSLGDTAMSSSKIVVKTTRI